MILDQRSDYWDLQAQCLRRGNAVIRAIDEDGYESNMNLITYDGDGVEFFNFLGIPYEIKSQGHHRSFYMAKDRSLVWARSSEMQVSVQLKGLLFADPNYKSVVGKIVSFFKTRNYPLHPSRCDVRKLFRTDEQALYRSLLKMDWGKMYSLYRLERRQGAGFESKHSRGEIDFYNKSRQVLAAKKDAPLYVSRLLAILGATEIPSDLMNVDFRIRQKDQTRLIAELLLADVIDFDRIEQIVINKCQSRVKFPRSLKKF